MGFSDQVEILDSVGNGQGRAKKGGYDVQKGGLRCAKRGVTMCIKIFEALRHKGWRGVKNPKSL